MQTVGPLCAFSAWEMTWLIFCFEYYLFNTTLILERPTRASEQGAPRTRYSRKKTQSLPGPVTEVSEGPGMSLRAGSLERASFSFLYLKKIKIYMSVLKNSKMTPGRPVQGWQGSCRSSNRRQDLNVIFFSKRIYIFEILIFFKYKKEKIARSEKPHCGPAAPTGHERKTTLRSNGPFREGRGVASSGRYLFGQSGSSTGLTVL